MFPGLGGIGRALGSRSPPHLPGGHHRSEEDEEEAQAKLLIDKKDPWAEDSSAHLKGPPIIGPVLGGGGGSGDGGGSGGREHDRAAAAAAAAAAGAAGGGGRGRGGRGAAGSPPAAGGPPSRASRAPPYIILPDSQARRVWMQVQLVVALYIVWVTPFRVGFNLPAEGVWFWVEGAIDAFFHADLALNFFVAYEDPVTGDPITDPRRIAARYLKGWFIVDLLSTFPADYIVRAAEGTWLCSLRGDCSWAASAPAAGGGVGTVRLLRVLRVFRVLWILKHFKYMRLATLLGGLADDLYGIAPLLTLAELAAVLLYLGHASGCFFYLASTPPYQTAVERRLIEQGELEPWVAKTFGGDRLIVVPTVMRAPVNNGSGLAGLAGSNGTYANSSIPSYACPEFGYDLHPCAGCDGPKARCISHYSLPFRYITAMYWAYTTMTTVGYGDISGVTVAERICAIITMVGSGFFFSFVVGRVAAVVARLDAVAAAHSARIETVATFLKDVDLPRGLGRRVLDFHRKQQVKPYDRQQVLAALPFELRSQVLRHLYAGVISRTPLLRAVARDEVFLTDVCVRLQHVTRPRDSFVYQRGEISGDVFILVRGALAVLDAGGATPLAAIPEGAVFGEATVLRQIDGAVHAKRTDSVVCTEPATMLRIAKEDVVDLLERYPQLLDTLRRLSAARAHEQQKLQGQIKAGRAAAATAAPGPDGPAPPLLRSASTAALAGPRRVPSGKRHAAAGAAAPLPALLDVHEAYTPRGPFAAVSGSAFAMGEDAFGAPHEPPPPPPPHQHQRQHQHQQQRHGSGSARAVRLSTARLRRVRAGRAAAASDDSGSGTGRARAERGGKTGSSSTSSGGGVGGGDGGTTRASRSSSSSSSSSSHSSDGDASDTSAGDGGRSNSPAARARTQAGLDRAPTN